MENNSVKPTYIDTLMMSTNVQILNMEKTYQYQFLGLSHLSPDAN